MQINNTALFLVYLLLSVSLFSCKKQTEVLSPEHNTEYKQVLDSIFLYSSQIYYWNNSLPKYVDFNFAKYSGSDPLSVYTQEIFDITNYAINTQTGKSFEFSKSNPSEAKFSTIIDRENTPNNNNYNLSEIGYNYGITLVASGNSIYIEYAITNSPAEQAGVKRGMRITEINGIKSEATETFFSYIKTAFDKNQIELTLSTKSSPDKSEKYTLKHTAYLPDPVNKVSILKINNTAIGYISYIKFSSTRGRDESLNAAFTYFNNENVKELIINLRYNGGGDVSTCENFANLITTQSANGKIMRKEKYNLLMQKGNAKILSNQPILNDDGSPAFIINGRTATLADGDYSIEGNTILFQKTAGLKNLSRIYFIVSQHTASVSELLINSLKPYLDIKLVGVRTTENITAPVKTFGKPIGFFPIRIKSYFLYLSLFQNLNANDDGGYFDGLDTDFSTEDDIETDFGDVEESGIKTAISNMGYLPKTALAKNKILESKSGTVINKVSSKIEIFSASPYQPLIKSKTNIPIILPTNYYKNEKQF